MNEQLQKELAAWLGQLREAAQHGASFALDQAPLVVREKVLYGRVTETLLLLAGIAIVVLAVKAFRFGWTYKPSRDVYGDDTGIVVTVASVILGTLAFIATLAQMESAAMVWFAPRLYVLEWLAGLLK